MKNKLLIAVCLTSALLISCNTTDNQVRANPDYGNGYDIEYVKHLKGETRLYKDTNGCYWIGETDVSNLTQVMQKGYAGGTNTVPMCDN